MDIVLDCSCGLAGDMFLAALFDAGLDKEEFGRQIKSILPSEIDFKIFKEKRCGISGVRFEVCSPVHSHKPTHSHKHSHGNNHSHQHNHSHDHDSGAEEIHSHTEHHHRGFGEIKNLIMQSSLNEKVKTKSVEMFLDLARVEAKAHGVDIESVHFHEVGALDSIVDIVGAALAVDMLGVENIYVSEVALGKGVVKAMHGVMPVPAPATSELIKDTSLVFKFGPEEKELLTPTGALILKTFAKQIPDDYDFKILKTGYGAGFYDFETRPNVVKVFFSQRVKEEKKCDDSICVIEANIDDMPSFICDNLLKKLLGAGALDVFFTNIMMKKNRPAILLSVLCEIDDRNIMEEIIFKESTTIGLRFYLCSRTELNREMKTVSIKYGDVRVKVSGKDGVVYNEMPEYEDCLALAEVNNIPLKEIYKMVYAVI